MKVSFLLILFCLITFSSCQKEEDCHQEIPEWCARVDILPTGNPVCGCDGNTYSNEPSATCAGIRVNYSGSCLDTN